MASLYLPPLHALFLSALSVPLLFGCNHHKANSTPYIVNPAVISDEANVQRKTFDIPIGESVGNATTAAKIPPVTVQQLYSVQKQNQTAQRTYQTALRNKHYHYSVLNTLTVTATTEQRQQAQLQYRKANLAALFAQRQLEILQQQQVGIQRSLNLAKQKKAVKKQKIVTHEGIEGIRTGSSFKIRLSLAENSIFTQKTLQQLDTLATLLKRSKQHIQLIAYRADTNDFTHDQGMSAHHINTVVVQLLKRGVKATQLIKKIKPLIINSEKPLFLQQPYVDLVLVLS